VSVFVVKRENRNFDSDFRWLLCNSYACLWLKWRFRCDYLVISVVKGPVVSYTALCTWNFVIASCVQSNSTESEAIFVWNIFHNGVLDKLMSLQKISYSSLLKVRIRDTGHVMNENLWYQVLWTYSSFISMNSTSQNCVMCVMHYGLLHALVECALNPGFRKFKI